MTPIRRKWFLVIFLAVLSIAGTLAAAEDGNNGQAPKLSLYPYLGDFLRELEEFRTRESLEYDLLHSHYWLSGKVGKWAGERWDVPHVFMFHTVAAVKNSTDGFRLA